LLQKTVPKIHFRFFEFIAAEGLASFMRRIGICEERGSGIDKVVAQTELYQLPAPSFEQTDKHTRVVLFAHQDYHDMARRIVFVSATSTAA